jgi:hypothetical protein
METSPEVTASRQLTWWQLLGRSLKRQTGAMMVRGQERDLREAAARNLYAGHITSRPDLWAGKTWRVPGEQARALERSCKDILALEVNSQAVLRSCKRLDPPCQIHDFRTLLMITQIILQSTSRITPRSRTPNQRLRSHDYRGGTKPGESEKTFRQRFREGEHRRGGRHGRKRRMMAGNP